jgi:hypothetical protein
MTYSSNCLPLSKNMTVKLNKAREPTRFCRSSLLHVYFLTGQEIQNGHRLHTTLARWHCGTTHLYQTYAYHAVKHHDIKAYKLRSDKVWSASNSCHTYHPKEYNTKTFQRVEKVITFYDHVRNRVVAG